MYLLRPFHTGAGLNAHRIRFQPMRIECALNPHALRSHCKNESSQFHFAMRNHHVTTDTTPIALPTARMLAPQIMDAHDAVILLLFAQLWLLYNKNSRRMRRIATRRKRDRERREHRRRLSSFMEEQRIRLREHQFMRKRRLRSISVCCMSALRTVLMASFHTNYFLQETCFVSDSEFKYSTQCVELAKKPTVVARYTKRKVRNRLVERQSEND